MKVPLIAEDQIVLMIRWRKSPPPQKALARGTAVRAGNIEVKPTLAAKQEKLHKLFSLVKNYLLPQLIITRFSFMSDLGILLCFKTATLLSL